MCNCGKKRTGLTQQSNVSRINAESNIQPPLVQKQETVLFQYTGKTGLSVTGNRTRKNYRFSFSGDVQQVDFSDAFSMMNIPVLTRIN